MFAFFNRLQIIFSAYPQCGYRFMIEPLTGWALKSLIDQTLIAEEVPMTV